MSSKAKEQAAEVSIFLRGLRFAEADSNGWRDNDTGVRAVLNIDDECCELFQFIGKHRGVMAYQLRLSLGLPLSVIMSAIKSFVDASA